jgi:hypothetical protein
MMLMNEMPDSPDQGMIPLLAAAELQDHLMTVTNDLERLQRLIDDAGESLSLHFFSATAHLNTVLSRESDTASANAQSLRNVLEEIGNAITALQFQDMATQLVAHTSQRLRNCADQLARDTFGDDEDGTTVVEIAPLRPNPVTQDEMDAGSVELF